MQKKTIWYLKGYYGYKNFGDELLWLGVIRYLFTHYPLEKLYIEVDDPDWFWSWLDRHQSLVWEYLCKVKLVSKHDKYNVVRLSILTKDVHIFLWGWEVLCPARWWFHGGWNIGILYAIQFLRRNVTLLWWVSKAKNTLFKALYSFVLSRCDKIVLRDPQSYKYVVSNYVFDGSTLLYHDFWLDIVDSLLLSDQTSKTTMSKTCPSCPYMICNSTQYVDSSWLTDVVRSLTQKYGLSSVVYFCWERPDKRFWDDLSLYLWWQLLTHFDRTESTLFDVFCLFRGASCGVAVRLHVIAMLARLGIPFEYIVYQEKVEKFLAANKHEHIGK